MKEKPETTGKKENRKHHNGPLLVFTGVLLLAILAYMSYVPLPVYEKAESDRNTADALVGDPDAMAEEHQAMIVKAQNLYNKRRNEIIQEVRTGPITSTAIDICKAMIDDGDYGPNAVFAGFEWFCPESEEEMDLSLSVEEAEKLLYLYSSLYDMDFMEGEEDGFEKWFYGDGSVQLYPVDAFGSTFYLTGHGGHFLDMITLNRAKLEAEQAARKEMQKARAEMMVSVPGNMAFSFLAGIFTQFIPAAEADYAVMDSNLADRCSQRYNDVMESYYSSCGRSFADLAIFTGISDQLTGRPSFSFINEPNGDIWSGTSKGGSSTWSGKIEEYALDGKAKEAVASYNANPFAGRLLIPVEVTYGPVEEDDCWEDGGYYRGNSWVQVPVHVYTRYTQKVDCSIDIGAYDCQEYVSFTGTFNVNASTMAEKIAAALDWAVSQAGSTNFKDGHWVYNSSDLAWCAAFASDILRWNGLEDYITYDLSAPLLFKTLTDEKGHVNPSATDHIGHGYRWWKANGTKQLSTDGSGYDIQVGDYFFFSNDDAANAITHVGWVVGSTDDKIVIVEGNWGGTDNYNSRVHLREISDINADGIKCARIVHPEWEADDAYYEAVNGNPLQCKIKEQESGVIAVNGDGLSPEDAVWADGWGPSV